MYHNYDVIKTIGGYYQVFRTDDNTPMASAFRTRHEAEEYMYSLYSEDAGMDEEVIGSNLPVGQKEVGKHPLNKAEVS